MLAYDEDADENDGFDWIVGRLEMYKNPDKCEVAMVLFEEHDGTGQRALMVLNLEQMQKIHAQLSDAILDFIPTDGRPN